jgi:hypothetical protein
MKDMPGKIGAADWRTEEMNDGQAMPFCLPVNAAAFYRVPYDRQSRDQRRQVVMRNIQCNMVSSC